VAEPAEVIAAIESGDAGQLKDLLAQDHSLAAARDASGVSALMHALYRQRKDMTDVLRAGRGELDIFEAASLGRSDLIEDLVSRDPRLANARSGDGFTPLHFAAFFGQESVARVLLEHHADAAAVELQLFQPLGDGVGQFGPGRPHVAVVVDEFVVADSRAVPQIEQCFLSPRGLVSGQEPVGVIAVRRNRRRSVRAGASCRAP